MLVYTTYLYYLSMIVADSAPAVGEHSSLSWLPNLQCWFTYIIPSDNLTYVAIEIGDLPLIFP